jgi:hypothetical protein
LGPGQSTDPDSVCPYSDYPSRLPPPVLQMVEKDEKGFGFCIVLLDFGFRFIVATSAVSQLIA